MKTAEPKTIYLQIGEDADITEFKKEDFETNAITWCWERIFKNDIEYISKQSIIELIDEMIKENDMATENAEPLKRNKYYYANEILIELKQKIEEL